VTEKRWPIALYLRGIPGVEQTWQQVPAERDPDEMRQIGYEVVEVVPAPSEHLQVGGGVGIVPTKELGGYAHQVALWRLAAVDQYLYDTMAGDAESERPEPLPLLAMEKVREAQAAIHQAIKNGQRTRRTCLGGEMKLAERWKPEQLAAEHSRGARLDRSPTERTQAMNDKQVERVVLPPMHPEVAEELQTLAAAAGLTNIAHEIRKALEGQEGEVRERFPYASRGVGLPDGYVDLDDASPEQLVAAIPGLLRRNADLEDRIAELERQP